MRNEKYYARFDADSALIVQKGIALQDAVSTAYAAAFLKSEHVASSVILRVLLRPQERRNRRR